MEAVIFDMDGTIVNTEPFHAKAASIVLNNLGIAVDLEASIDTFYGMADTEVLKMMCPDFTENDIEETIKKKNIELIRLFENLSHIEKAKYITPGLFDFLVHLKKYSIKSAVVSASEDIIVEKTLNCFEIDILVDLQMGRNQTKLTKPNPDPYIEGMRRLNVSANKTLVFEDSPTGLQSAIASQARVARITGFAHSDKILHNVELKNFLF